MARLPLSKGQRELARAQVKGVIQESIIEELIEGLVDTKWKRRGESNYPLIGEAEISWPSFSALRKRLEAVGFEFMQGHNTFEMYYTGVPVSQHFVVTIDIKQVSSGEQTSSSTPNYANRAPATPSERSITDLIHVVVKADTKEEAIVKANGILAIS